MKPGKILLNVPLTYNSKQSQNRREFFINDLVKHHKWSVGAEIGVREGRTLFCLLENNPQLHMYAVDRKIDQFYNQQIKEKYNNRLTALEGLSWDMAASVADKSLDFFFIDAGHGYKSVMNDLNAWIPKLKDSGWFIGHDINFPAVNQAVKDKFGTFEVGPDNVWFLSPDKNYNFLEKV